MAQQSRRQKLRFPTSDDLPGNFPVTGGSSMVFPCMEMMNFAPVEGAGFVGPTNPAPFPYPFQPGQSENLMLPHFSPHPTTSIGISSSDNYQNNVVSNWDNGVNNELALLPSFVNGPGPRHHGLSLTLSSNQIGQELKPFESGTGTVSSVVNPIEDIVGGSIHVYRNVGPLGPFTGYTTILKNSRFLKPAQQLLDDFLNAAGLRPVRGCEEEESACGTPNPNLNVDPRHHGSNDLSSGSASCESYRPDCHEKKTKLLHMQEEVCKRHKQYHQQMEMAMTAFESVPGLGNATPFISRSLKIISRHFRCIKNAIADQLKHIKKAVGEDLSSPTSMTKSESTRLRFEQNFSKVKTGGFGGPGYMGQQNHIWRPQRGLPERAVSILRAWLFDHFLHPYPTDTDKQMLATQTGLSRNQVSNWFINARVRLWKPMVEEIHMLETKGGPRSEPNSNNSGVSPTGNQAANVIVSDKQFECMGSSSSMEGCRGGTSTEPLFQKRSRMETHQIPTTMDGSLLGFLPYQRRGLDMGGIGAVSLTLGLRHGSETSQQQLQHQFQQQGLHFGSHVIHDFSG